MNYRFSIIISVVLHVSVLIYLVWTPKPIYTPQKKYVSIALAKPELKPEVVEKPNVEPDPPIENEVKKTKASKDLIKDLQEKVKPTPKRKPTMTPTTAPTKKPTNKPTPKPKATATQVPTKKPTQTPSPSPTPRPTIPENAVPLSKIADLLTPRPTASADVKSASEYLIDIQGSASLETKQTYGAALSRHLYRFWKPPSVRAPSSDEFATYVSFTINHDGSIDNLKVIIPSGWPLMDQTVMDGVNKALPVPPLQELFASTSIQVTVPFVLDTSRFN